jgi:hypothetical protein
MESPLVCSPPIDIVLIKAMFETSSARLGSVFVVPDPDVWVSKERTQNRIRIILSLESRYGVPPGRINLVQKA